MLFVIGNGSVAERVAIFVLTSPKALRFFLIIVVEEGLSPLYTCINLVRLILAKLAAEFSFWEKT